MLELLGGAIAGRALAADGKIGRAAFTAEAEARGPTIDPRDSATIALKRSTLAAAAFAATAASR
jgi:hypothetical protein